LTFAAAATAQRLLVDVTGKWTFSVVAETGTNTPAVTLKQVGEKLTGTMSLACSARAISKGP